MQLSAEKKNVIVHDFIVEHFGIDYWEDYQREVFLSPYRKEMVVKARQVGLSFAFSADALARALLFGEQFLITSYSKDEASEKIGYIRDVFLPRIRLSIPKVRHDATFTISFENGGEVKSVPARSVRGRSKNIYADEFEYYKNMADVYRAILPSIVREDDIVRRLRVFSTPLSKDGLMYRIISNEKRKYNVRYVYWWQSRALCKDVERAKEEAPFMETYDRVYRFGTPSLIEQFEDAGMGIEEFRREFECDFGAVSDATFLPLETIMEVVNEDIPYRQFNSDNFVFAYNGKVRIGMDVGRRNNATEIMVVDENNRLLCNISLRNTNFNVQKLVCEKLLNTLNVESFSIDAVGIGMNLAEDLRREYGSVINTVEFTAREKDRIASNLKKLIETKRIELPYDRKLISHLLSLKREVLEGSGLPKYYVVQTVTGDSANADKFWALAMAVVERNKEVVYAVAQNPMIGYVKPERLSIGRFLRIRRV